jgi:bile acid:Na+ symporter, BASS family
MGAAPPFWFAGLAATAIFTVMLSLGLLLGREQLAAALRRRNVLAAIVLGVIVPLPILAVLLVKFLSLEGPVRLGIILMSVSPGAPLALRRAIDAGGHARFAPALHLAIVLLAVVTVPASIAILNVVFGVAFKVSPVDVARQVFFSQLLPIGLGALTFAFRPGLAARIEPPLEKLSNVLFIGLALACVYFLGGLLIEIGWLPILAGAGLTGCALAVGAACAGRDVDARPPAAVAAAMRNPGLALLIASLNKADAAVAAVVFGYALGAAVLVAAYVAWQIRSRRSNAH